MRKPKVPRPRPRIYTPEEVARIVAVTEAWPVSLTGSRWQRAGATKWYAYFWRFLYASGARVNEALRLKWSDVTETTVTLPASKGGKPISLPLDSPPFHELRDVLEALRPLTGHCERVFGWFRHISAPLDILHVVATRAGISGATLKTFRSSAAHRLTVVYGASDSTAARLLRHGRDVHMTHYDAGRSADELAAILAREMGTNGQNAAT